MKRTLSAIFIFIFFSLQFFAFVNPGTVKGYYTNMPASVVVGQADFASNSADRGGSVGANTVQNPGATFVAGNRLIVSDGPNNRVLIWNSIPTTNGTPADVVVGQQNFTSDSLNQGGSCAANTLRVPAAIYSDGMRLIIPDQSNHRVLIFNQIPTTNNASADVVIGQQDFTSCLANQGGAVGANTLNTSDAVWVDGTKLFIVDALNHRVLIYNNIPTSNNSSADVVVGQTNFTNNSANQGGAVAANTLNLPNFLTTYHGKLILSDRDNNRVLIYNSIPTTNNASADVVVGQTNFANNSANQGGTAGPNTLYKPQQPYIYNNRLFVSEDSEGSTFNSRVLIFNSLPTTNNASADVVIGQPNFISGAANQGGSPAANTLNRSVGVHVIGEKMIIADRINHRVLIYDNSLRDPLISLGTIESAAEGKLRIRGNVRLGEWGRYFLSGSNLTVSVNGGGFGNVSSLYGNREDAHDNLYEFFHEFEPGVGGYTLLFRAFSSNADEEHAFYFSPFELKSIVSGNLPIFTFQINSKYWTHISDNLSEYQVEVKKEGTDTWTTYLEDIPVSANTTNLAFLTTFDQTTGTISARSNSKTLPGGKYQARMVALDKWNHKQYSPSLGFTAEGVPSYKPTGKTIYNGWSPSR
jgi:predicted outer membrane repeat protein